MSILLLSYTPSNMPLAVIVETSDLMRVFYTSNLGFPLLRDDLRDIVSDIIVTFLNEGEEDCAEYGIPLPSFHRMRDVSFLSDVDKQAVLTKAVLWFKDELHKRLTLIGCFEGVIFNYFFYAFVGDDVLLHRLPH